MRLLRYLQHIRGDADTRVAGNLVTTTTAQAVGEANTTGAASSTTNSANSRNPNNLGARNRTPVGGMGTTYADASRTPARHGAAPSAQEDARMDRVQRTYEQQVADAIQNRNIIEIELTEINGRGNLTPLSETDIAIIFFDYLRIRPEDATRIATRTSSFTMREIELKPDVAQSSTSTRTTSHTTPPRHQRKPDATLTIAHPPNSTTEPRR